MTTHVIPAARLLTVVHIKDPDVTAHIEWTPDNHWRAGRVQLTADSHDGRTLCGQPMLAHELWQAWTVPHRDDRMCAACETRAAPYVEEGLF